MRLFISALFFVIIILSGCAEKPASVGNGLPNNDGIFTIVDTTFYVSPLNKDTTYKTSYATGYSLSNLTGRISPTEELITLINFFPGGTIDSLKGARIDSAALILTVNYLYFPQTPTVSFNIVEIQRSWSQESFSSDSLPLMTFGSKVIGTFSDTMKFASSVTAYLDTLEIRRWADSYIDTSSLIPDFYGFAIQAPSGVTTGAVGFSTFSSYSVYVPQLFIRYTKDGRRDSLSFFSGADAYAARYTGSTNFAPLIVRGGFGIRSKVQFDLSSLVNKPIINAASLELTMDTLSSSFGGYSPDTLIALLGMSGTNIDQSDSTIYVYGLKTAAAAGQPPVYSFNMTGITDRWVRGLNPNHGVTLRWGTEYTSVEKAVFFPSTHAESAKRPKLKVIYSQK